MKTTIQKILTFLNMIIPKKNNIILFTSYPDMSDNSYAMYEYMLHSHSHNNIFVWLVEADFDIDSIAKQENTKIISKKSFIGLYYFFRAKYIFYTHGLYNGIKSPSSQIVVNLWHGMPLKNIGYLDNKSEFPESNFTIATSKTFQKLMSDAFCQPLDRVLISGQPRNQYLLDNSADILKKFNIDKHAYKKVIAWLPTYRKSTFGDIRNDGETQELLPLLNKHELITINKAFQEKNIFCIIKLHPMDTLTKKDFTSYSNIKVISNEDLVSNSTQLYSLLANTHALITDYSSVYIDYMLTKKPIAFVIPDLESYNNSRGFTIDNVVEHLPGTIIQKKTELENFIHDLAEDKISASYIDDGLFEFYHSVDNHFSENIYNVVFNQAGKL